MSFYVAIVLAVALGVSVFANIRMYRKVSYYEQWYQQFATRVKHMRQELYRIDSLGAFRADDEVGYFFEALKRMSMELFKMGFFEDMPEEPEPARRSAINVTTRQQDTPMEPEQAEQYEDAIGPQNSVEIPEPPEQKDS